MYNHGESILRSPGIRILLRRRAILIRTRFRHSKPTMSQRLQDTTYIPY